MKDKITILGIQLDNISKDKALEKIKVFLEGNKLNTIFTPNPEMLVDAQRDDEFKTILNNADLAVADGFGIVMASSILNQGPVYRISGSDLTINIFAIAEKMNKSVFLLGGLPGVVQEAEKIINEQFPNLRIVGADSGGRLIRENGDWIIGDGLITRINEAEPDILIVGRGHPWQEKFINDFKYHFKTIKLAIGVGGTFDFISGRIKRAPLIFRKLGLEWVWRLVQEPSRLPRIYKAVIKFLLFVNKEKSMLGKKKFKVRFAPSPTGFLHIGGLRTALYNWLFCKKHNGTFVLRIEDTDKTRTVKGGEQDILKSLKWAGIEPDEGVYLSGDKAAQKGKYGPYRQSERLETYKNYVDELISKDKAYYCFCTEERLRTMRDEQSAKKQAPRYDGTCKNLSKEDIQNKLESKIPYVVRLKVPEEGRTAFDDEIHGTINFENKEIDDQVLLKSDGYPTYHLANVVDDHLMKITHVIRGEEWLPSTPKHVLLYDAFGWKPPVFAHLPLLLNPDKSKLSKRQGDVAVKDYREAGYLPEAINNFVALLGWNPKSDQEIYNMGELADLFELRDVNKSGAVFNREKLDWLNNHYIRETDIGELTKMVIPYLVKQALISKDEAEEKFEWLSKIVLLLRERAQTLADFSEESGLYFKKMVQYNVELLKWKEMDISEAKQNLEGVYELLSNISENEFIAQNIEAEVKKWINDNGLKNGPVLWPMRVALSGEEKSPPPFDLAEIFGKEESLKRIQNAINLI